MHVDGQVDGQDDLVKFKPSTRMRKKGDLSDFKSGMGVDGKWATAAEERSGS